MGGKGMEQVTVKKSDITRIKYKADVTIYYTADNFYVCTVDSEVDWDNSLLLTLAGKRGGDND